MFQVCGPDLFATLIPMAAHEASSVYSERKAQILRGISKMVEDKEADLAAYESSLKISKKDLFAMMVSSAGRSVRNKVNVRPMRPWGYARTLSLMCREFQKKPVLPPDVIEVCAQFSTNRLSISSINSQLAQIDAMSDEVGKYLSEAEQLIAMSNPASVTSNVVADLKAELNKYKEIRSQSANNNGTLRKALKDHDEYLALLQLAPEVLEQKLPHVIAVTREDEKVILEFIKLLDKLEEMKQQRQKLFNELRDSLINDDITKLIVANAQEDLNEVFENALSKHRQSIAILERNLLAQDNILKAVSQANANTAEIRLNLEQARKPWTSSIEGLRAAYKSFEEVGLHATKGTDFYGIFVTDVRRLVTRLRSVVQVEKEQEERLRARQAELAQPAVVKPGVSPAFSPRTPVMPPSSAAQGGQPPKLKDYLTMMNNAKKNEYVPQAMPGSPGISHHSLQPSIAMSSMGSSTSLTSNAQPPQMSLPTSINQAPSQTASTSAVLPPGAQIVPPQVQAALTSTVVQPQAAYSHGTNTSLVNQNITGAGGMMSPAPSNAYNSAQANQTYNGYQVNNHANYNQSLYHGYAPYAHLYSTSTPSSNGAATTITDPKSIAPTDAPSVQMTTGNPAYPTPQPPQSQTSLQYNRAGISGARMNGTNSTNNGGIDPRVALATNPPSSVADALPNAPVTTMNQAQYYVNASENAASAGAVENAYRWSGYNLPSAVPTASASTVMTSGAYNSVLTSSNNIYNTPNSYTQYYQVYGQQYKGYDASSQANPPPNSASQMVSGYPYTAAVLSNLPQAQQGAPTITPAVASATHPQAQYPPQVPATSTANPNVWPGSASAASAMAPVQNTNSMDPTASSQPKSNPVAHLRPNAQNDQTHLTSQYLPPAANASSHAYVQSYPQQTVSTLSQQAMIPPASTNSRQLNSLLDESPALQMSSEGKMPQNILQPVVLSAVAEPEKIHKTAPETAPNGSGSDMVRSLT